MSHPDLIIAAKLAKKRNPVEALGEYVIAMLREKLSVPAPYDQEDWTETDDELSELAYNLGISLPEPE